MDDIDPGKLQTGKRNAFSELMSPKPKKQKPILPKQVRTDTNNLRDPRNGLLVYVRDPASYPAQVITYNDNAVLIRDAFPKATLHLLVLPRDPSKINLHPHTAFDDPAFLTMVRSEVDVFFKLAVSELSRLISPFSASSKAKNAAMESEDPPDELPMGREFSRDLRVGIHAHPSMNHLHIHIISRDMHSDRLKHRKHYNSFNTEFFIPLDDFPLAEDDQRRDVAYQNANLSRDFRCWKCGQNFGNKFQELKRHLQGEYEEWRNE